jgi:hypothetical protein
VASSRGAAFDDLDNDGDVDIVVLNSRAAPTILRNDTPNANHWLELSVRGSAANRDAVGTRATVVSGDLTRMAAIHSGRGYQSHFGSRLHFGLGRRDRIDRLVLRWPDGRESRYEGIEVDTHILIAQGNTSPTVLP